MRILYVISGLTFGGAERQLVGLARQLAGRGHEVAIFTLNRDVPRTPQLAGSAVRLIVDQKRGRLDPAVLWRLRKTIDRWRPALMRDSGFAAWIWRQGEHSVTSGTSCAPDGKFDSGFFTEGQTWSFTFTEPGEFPYYCKRHESMKGTVRVTPKE